MILYKNKIQHPAHNQKPHIFTLQLTTSQGGRRQQERM